MAREADTERAAAVFGLTTFRAEAGGETDDHLPAHYVSPLTVTTAGVALCSTDAGRCRAHHRCGPCPPDTRIRGRDEH